MPQYRPYLTDDGSIGLYSEDFSDVFHSRNGALSEAYEKFVIPADLFSVLENYNEINLLDICYGIGYNSKAFLNFLIKNFFLRNKFFDKSHNNVSIDEDNFNKNNLITITSDTIYTDKKSAKIFTESNPKKEIKNCNLQTKNVGDVNLQNEQQIEDENVFDKFCPTPAKNENIDAYKINIDAIEMEKEFVYLSPFIKENCRINDLKILPVINELIADTLSFQFNDEFSSYIKKFSREKKYSRFFVFDKHDFGQFSHKMTNYKRNEGYNYPSQGRLKAFLHNIYYRHISKQPAGWSEVYTTDNYQYVSKRYYPEIYNQLKNQVNLKFYFDDARVVIKNLNKKYNFIFLDAFTPSKAPCLWSVEFFTKLAERLTADGVILTYSRSARVRSAMSAAGLFVGNIYNSENQSIGTIVSPDKNKIKHPLDSIEMEKLNTKSGIPYRDTNLCQSNQSILDNLNLEINNSNLQTVSQVLKINNKNSEDDNGYN